MERPSLEIKIGWLDHLANATHQHYGANNTGGPSLQVWALICHILVIFSVFLVYFYS